ncbi:MAG: DUF4832 domain-containing protein [Bacteroidota bacterium]
MKYLSTTFYLAAIMLWATTSFGHDNGGSDPIVKIEDGFAVMTTKGVLNIVYKPSDEDFANPERGFYRASSTRSNNYSPLTVAELKEYRKGPAVGSAPGAYSTRSSLLWRYFIMPDFVDKPISSEFLAKLQADLDVIRESGMKLIPRFSYNNSQGRGQCPEGTICPPYKDAPKAIVLEHIKQLGPILTKNADVILTVQMGFIGLWGENYYTDYFGDASANGGIRKLLDKNWQDRIDVLNAMLNALPKDMMVQVRYPQMKQRTVYGINAMTTTAPLTAKEAYSGSAKSRIGFHNDCLLASADDLGTYKDYGNSSSAAKQDIPNLKPYFAEDSKYVLVGGETCSDAFSPQNNCAPEGIADLDLRKLHYTYLNANYNNQVNGDWVEGGCMEAIKRNLGYRIALDSAKINTEVKAGKTLSVNLHLSNLGYAAPSKKRPVYLVLRNASGVTKYEFKTDVRFWMSGANLSGSFKLPASLKPGSYEVLLHLPDANASIASRPEYAIRLANDLWEAETGMNNLKQVITIL